MQAERRGQRLWPWANISCDVGFCGILGRVNELKWGGRHQNLWAWACA